MQNGLLLGVLIIAVLLVFALIVTALINMFIAPTIPTPKKILKEIIDHMSIAEMDKVFDLGAGFGRVGFSILNRHKCHVVLYEISPLHILGARIRQFIRFFNFKRQGRVEVHLESLLRADFKTADKAFCHLNKKVMLKLEPKIVEHLNHGLVLYSYKFPLPNLKPAKTYTLSNDVELFVYKI